MQTNGLVEDQERDASLLRRSMDEIEAFLFQELFTNRFLINMLIPLNYSSSCWEQHLSFVGWLPRRILYRTVVNKPIDLMLICRITKNGRDYHNLFEVVGFFLRNALTAAV